MTLALLITLAALGLAAIAGLVVLTVRARTSPGPPLTGRTLVVHTRDDQSLRGVVTATHADRVTLHEAFYLHASGEQPAGGLVHVPVANIAWLQEIEP